MVDRCRNRSSWWPPCWTTTTSPCFMRSAGTRVRIAWRTSWPKERGCGWCAHPIRLRGYVLAGKRSDRLLQSRLPGQRGAQGVWVAQRAAVPVVRHPLPGRRPPPRSCRPRRRQGHRRVGCRTPGGLLDPYRSGLRCRAPGGSDGTVSCRAHPIALPSWPSAGVSGPARSWRRSGGHTPLRELLRLRRRRAAQCLQRRAVATHHHLRHTAAGDVAWDFTIRVRQGPPSRARQGGRVPAPGIGALPRCAAS